MSMQPTIAQANAAALASFLINLRAQDAEAFVSGDWARCDRIRECMDEVRSALDAAGRVAN